MEESVAQKLKEVQNISKLTQNEIAGLLGVSFPTLNSWWNGKSTPRKGALAKIEALYDKYCVTKNDEIISPPRPLISSRPKNLILEQILSNKSILEALVVRLTYHSNAMEGSTLSEKETSLVILENQNLPDKTLIEQIEAKNHKSAILHLFDHLKKGGEVDETLTKKLHLLLMNGVIESAGNYRFHQVRIAGTNVVTSNYLKVPELIRELFERELPSDAPAIVPFIAKFHADFEKIHPFADGNGRIGRLILNGMLLSQNITPAILEKEKKLAYYNALETAQNNNDYMLIEKFIESAIIEGEKFLSFES